VKPKHKKHATPAKTAGESAKSPSAPVVKNNDRAAAWSVCVFLAVIVFIVFGQTLQFPFVNYDDKTNIYDNAVVMHGVTSFGITSAFDLHNKDNWIPLTTLSHMLDCELFGLNAGDHHLTNVLLHTASAILLFLALRKMTSKLWRSAFVASVFAIHPLAVESVAWVSERKDTLSGLFFMLTLWMYADYVRHPKSAARYIAALFFYALGLMSKPMLVTLPFILLLLDYWPLHRFTAPAAARLIVEKIPFLLLSAAASAVTFLVQRKIGAVQTLAALPLPLRIENACVSYARYAGKLLWPRDLAALYPMPGHWSAPLVLFSVALLLAISVAAIALRQKYPFILTGWFWFVGMLVPVIGLVQVGKQSIADRYVYLPQIGFCLALTWLVASLSARLRDHALILGGLSSAALIALACGAYVQTSYWKNSEALWTHTLACTKDNALGHDFLANTLWQEGRAPDAIAEYQEALEEDPHNASARNDYGYALFQEGQLDNAILQYQEAIQDDPNKVTVYDNLGNALFQKGQLDDAIVQYRKGLQINPDDTSAYNNLGMALAQKGQWDDAITEFQEALKLNDDDAGTHNNLGMAWFQKGRLDDAISEYKTAISKNAAFAPAYYNLGNAYRGKRMGAEAVASYQSAIQLQPDFASAQIDLAWMLATWPDASIRNGAQAVALAQQVAKSYSDPQVLRTLAAAYAETGRYSDAIATGQKALAMANDIKNSGLAAAIQKEIQLYQASSPCRTTEE
jgi:tetratricopeptide (TPR) repeat protein